MDERVLELVSEKVGNALEECGSKQAVSGKTVVFGDQSPLDSTGLVTLIVDIEEALYEEFQVELSLADERAMSQKRSPFKDVESLTTYVLQLMAESRNA